VLVLAMLMRKPCIWLKWNAQRTMRPEDPPCTYYAREKIDIGTWASLSNFFVTLFAKSKNVYKK